MGQVAATATPLTRDATAALFVPAYREVFGADPDRNRAELLLALVWIENANGAAFIQHNWGNLSGDAGDFWRPPWFDLEAVQALPEGAKKTRLLDLHQRMLDGRAPSAFRAFASHADGLRAWLRLLQKPGMRPVLEAASSGDAVRFAKAIHSSRYCPDPECLAAGPSYAKLRDLIHAADYFDGLKKKAQPVAELPGLWFWCWGLALSRRTRGRVAVAGEQRLMGEA